MPTPSYSCPWLPLPVTGAFLPPIAPQRLVRLGLLHLLLLLQEPRDLWLSAEAT